MICMKITNPFGHPSQVRTQVPVLQTCVDLYRLVATALYHILAFLKMLHLCVCVCVCVLFHPYLWIMITCTTREADPRSYEATKVVAKKFQKNNEASVSRASHHGKFDYPVEASEFFSGFSLQLL